MTRRARVIFLLCPIQFRFHPRIALCRRYYCASDENGPEGEPRMGNLVGRMRLRSVLVQMKFKASASSRRATPSRDRRYKWPDGG